MAAPRDEAEAQAQCLEQHLGPSACADLVSPFCGGRGVVIEFQKPPRCVLGEGSTRKAAIQLAEAQARAAPNLTPWLLVGGLVVGGLVLYAVTR